jgi:hypothetical protein
MDLIIWDALIKIEEKIIYSPSNREFEALQKASIDKRLKHFKNRVGGHCYLWLCCDGEGNFLYNYEKSGSECLCVWPAKEYALQVIKQEDQKYLTSMEIHYFLNSYSEELDSNNINIFVFPNKEMNGALMTAESFRNMMEEELAKYGDYDDEYENNSTERR